MRLLIFVVVLALLAIGLVSAAQVVHVEGGEVFLERTIVVDRGTQLAVTSEVLPFTSMQRCLDWRAKNAYLDFGTDRPTHEGRVYIVSITSECAAK